jgi:hypothetical protein
MISEIQEDPAHCCRRRIVTSHEKIAQRLQQFILVVISGRQRRQLPVGRRGLDEATDEVVRFQVFSFVVGNPGNDINLS